MTLPPTTPDLHDPTHRPYFLWWTNATVSDLRAHLTSEDAAVRAYWLGALLREANSRDVWLFTSVAKIREDWPEVVRYLGRSRPMWAWLLELNGEWPPRTASVG